MICIIRTAIQKFSWYYQPIILKFSMLIKQDVFCWTSLNLIIHSHYRRDILSNDWKLISLKFLFGFKSG